MFVTNIHKLKSSSQYVCKELEITPENCSNLTYSTISRRLSHPRDIFLTHRDTMTTAERKRDGCEIRPDESK